MATTAVVPVEIDTLYPTDGEVIAYVAMDYADGNHIASYTGREIILIHNASEDTAYNFTVTSEPDSLGRTGDMVDSIPFGETRAFCFAVKGWRNEDRELVMAAADPAPDPGLEIAVIRLPASIRRQ